MNRQTEELLLDYVEGELAGPARAQVDAMLAADPALRELIADLTADRALLRQVPAEQAPHWLRPPLPVLSRSLEADVRATSGAEPESAAMQPVLERTPHGWRLVLRAVLGTSAAAAAIAVASSLVLSASGGPSVSQQLAWVRSVSGLPADTVAARPETAPQGAVGRDVAAGAIAPSEDHSHASRPSQPPVRSVAQAIAASHSAAAGGSARVTSEAGRVADAAARHQGSGTALDARAVARASEAMPPYTMASAVVDGESGLVSGVVELKTMPPVPASPMAVQHQLLAAEQYALLTGSSRALISDQGRFDPVVAGPPVAQADAEADRPSQREEALPVARVLAGCSDLEFFERDLLAWLEAHGGFVDRYGPRVAPEDVWLALADHGIIDPALSEARMHNYRVRIPADQLEQFVAYLASQPGHRAELLRDMPEAATPQHSHGPGMHDAWADHLADLGLLPARIAGHVDHEADDHSAHAQRQATSSTRGRGRAPTSALLGHDWRQLLEQQLPLDPAAAAPSPRRAELIDVEIDVEIDYY